MMSLVRSTALASDGSRTVGLTVPTHIWYAPERNTTKSCESAGVKV